MTELDWIDGDPLMEAIAKTVYDRCGRSDSGLVIDDPRNIAVAAATALRDQQPAVLPAPADGQQKTRLLAHLYSNTSPVTETDLRERVTDGDLPRVTRDGDGFLLHIPETTYLDTQVWAIDVGLTADGLRHLRDAVLAILPAPADRAAVLREAAEYYENVLINTLAPDDVANDPRYCTAIRDIVMGLRHMADEAQQTSPARLLDCGLCYEENGEEIHPHPACTAERLAVLEAEHQRWEGVRDIVERAIDKGWSSIDTYQVEDALGPEIADEAQQAGPPAEVVHGCPPDGSGLTPCCGRTPFELPLGHRISSEAPITCVPIDGAQQAGEER